MGRLDSNAQAANRLRRNAQLLALGSTAFDLSPTGGLQISAGQLGILLNGTSLVLSSAGLAVNLRTNSGLQISSGLGVLLDTNSGLSLGAGGLSFSKLTTKGDLLGYSSTLTRLPVGTNGQVLTADSTTSTGIKWATASGGSSLLYANTADSTPITATGDTNFDLNYTLPANALTTGKVLRITASGKYTNGNAGAVNLILKLKMGTVSIFEPGAQSTPGFNTNVPVSFVFLVVCRSGGASANLETAMQSGYVFPNEIYVLSQNGPTPVDLTASEVIQMSAQWASSSCTITLDTFVIEALN